MNQALTIKDDMSLMDLGNVLSKSGYFTDARDAAQAIVKVLAGREMGFGPIASMTGIYIVKGKPSMGANLIAAAIKRSGRYDYRVKVLTDQECQIEFYERCDGKRELIGVSPFSITDANRAGTQNVDKYPRNMLFARAMSNGAKWFCADVFGGPIYTPEELGAPVNEEGEVIDNGVSWSEPLATQETEHDTIEGELIRPTEEVKQPAPEPEAQKDKSSTRKATVKQATLICDFARFNALADPFAKSHPRYAAKDGTLDRFHFLKAAGAEGYESITNENMEAVFNQVAHRHALEEKA